MKVGITGAGGFIGKHLVAAFTAAGHGVRALVHRAPAPGGVEARTIDLAHPDGLADAVAGLDAIVHAGAHVPASYTDPGEARACVEVNTLGTLAMLQAAVQASVPRFVQLSGNVYRWSPEPVAEDAPVEPAPRAVYYLASKAYADVFVEQFHRDGRVAAVILRPSAVYGPGLLRGMIPTFLGKLARGERITIDDGARYRADMVFVGDVAQATVTAVERGVTGTLNLGTGGTAGPLDVFDAIAKVVGGSRNIVDVLPPRAEPPIGFSPLAIDRARRELGYAPRSLDDGIAVYIDWWRAKR